MLENYQPGAQASQPPTRPCTCEPCRCEARNVVWLPGRRDQPDHPNHRRYGWCEGIWPGCHVHGPCTVCAAVPEYCTCEGGPRYDLVPDPDPFANGNPWQDRAWH